MRAKVNILRVLLIILMLSFIGCSRGDAENVIGDNKVEKDTTESNKSDKDNIDDNDKKDDVKTEQEVPGKEDDHVKKDNIVDVAIEFSQKGYFYSDSIAIEILSDSPGKIYYTLDGSDPSEKKMLYTKAIELKAGNNLMVTCLKAKEYFEEGTETKTIVHTYFINKNIENRFDTLVFSVTTDPYNLFDDVYGIFIEGKLRRDYIKENPNDKIEPNDPANYNMRGKESEREVYLEILEPDGTKIAEQAAGIRTYGGWSRANRQKSIKIFARKEYDEENNKIRYEFFPNKTNVDGTPLDTFKQLVLRNSGNDNGFAFIRDELFQTLANQAGYQDTEAVRPATLFVNGDYRGLFWLHEVYCDEYFEDHYGKYNGSFEILEGGETYKIPDEDGANQEIIEDYETMYEYAKLDLTDNTNYEKLCELIDVENYLSYYALQIYIGNEDWPHNNYKTYRYYAAEEEEYGKAPFDGKWRYLLHDLDFSFGIYGNGAYVDNINFYIGTNGETQEDCPLFGQLMKRPDCKEIFIKKSLDLINGSFASDNLNKVLEDMNASRLNEQRNMYNKNLVEDWVQFDQLEGRLQEIKAYGFQRSNHILTKYQEYFGLGEKYKLKVTPPEGCKVKVNSFTTDANFEGSYYKVYNTVIRAEVPKGKRFKYWLVNGEKVKGEELVITSESVVNGVVEVKGVLK